MGDIGDRVRRYRLWRGMTQQQLADLAGWTNSAVSMLENGHRGLDSRTRLRQLADALRVDPAGASIPHAVPCYRRGSPVGPVPPDRLQALVERERYRRDATGALIPRPPADIAYRLRTWYRARVTIGQVAELLRPGPQVMD